MTHPRRSKILAQACSVEALEERLLRTAWNWNAVAIHQDQAATDFPWITGAGQSVVVVDTGAWTGHPALAGRNIIWQDFVGTSTTPTDPDGHGTGVEGILVGNPFIYSGDGTYGQGIAPGAQLIVLRTDDGKNKTPWATQAQRLAAAMDWVIANQATYNIVAVNMSTGTNYGFTDPSLPGDPNAAIDQVLSQKFATLAGMGVFLGAAAGNDGATMPDTVEYPAADPNVFAVSSIDESGLVSSYASQGALTDLLAPANQIVMPYYFAKTPSLITTYYVNYGQGTSFASPQMVGAAVLLKQVDPLLTPAQLMAILQQTGTPTYDAATGHTFSLLNIDAAIKAVYAYYDDLSNHAMASATPLTFTDNAASLANLHALPHAADYYSFTLDSNSAVNFQVSSSGGAGVTMELLGANGSVLANVSAGPTLNLAAGTYYPRATGGDTAAFYQITLARTPDDGLGNNSIATAFALTFNNNAAAVSDLTLIGGFSDYYKFTIAQQSDVTLTLNYGGTDLPTATLVNGSGGSIAPISTSGVTERLAAGTYYIAVASNNTLSQTYGLAVTTGAVPTPDPTPDPNPTPGTTPGAGATAAKIAYDLYGRLHMAWFDGATHTLKYAVRDAGGNWGAVQTVDGSFNAGMQLSIAVDPYGTAGIAYYDGGTGRLKYARPSGSTWATSVIDSKGPTGWSPALCYTASGLPYIAYYSAASMDLRVATFSGKKWTLTTVDSKGNVGFCPAIAYDTGTNQIGVAYEDLSHGWFKYASTTGHGWRTSVVDTSTFAGGWSISLAFDASHLPAMTYTDAYSAGISFARSNGATWSVEHLGQTASAYGTASALSFESGVADIVYYNPYAGQTYRATPSGSVWSTTPITAGGTMLDEAVSLFGARTISWIDAQGVELRDI